MSAEPVFDSMQQTAAPLPDMTQVPPDDRDRVWFDTYYQGDRQRQLTFRAVLMGGALGGLLSISNLYTTLKLGWSFGVAITACVLSYTIWNAVVSMGMAKTKMSMLENNCMQSTASAAGYSTGGTLATAAGAMLLITGDDGRLGWIPLAVWVFFVAVLGVFIAIPMKRQMINQEQLPFPSGIAAAETLRSLYAEGEAAVKKARALIDSLLVGGIVGIAKTIGIIPGEISFGGSMTLNHLAVVRTAGATSFVPRTEDVPLGSMVGLSFEPGVMMIAAGMIVGMRVSVSMIIGSVLNYFIIPAVVATLPDWVEPLPPVETTVLPLPVDPAIGAGDPKGDVDHDGLTNELETRLGSNPGSADSDGDGLPDGIEIGDDAANPMNSDEDLYWVDLNGNGVMEGGKWTDLNADGSIDKGEWVAAGGDSEIHPRYNLIDPDDDNDRTLTRKEITVDNPLLADIPTNAAAAAGWVDANNNKRIDIEEITAPLILSVDGKKSDVVVVPPTPYGRVVGPLMSGLQGYNPYPPTLARYAAKDTDKDGISDQLDPDDDNDGVPSMEQRGKTFFGQYEVVRNADGGIDAFKITRWSLWLGTSLLVFSGLTAFALGWKTIVRAFRGIGAKQSAEDEKLAEIEVPVSWMVIGLIPTTIGLVALCWLAFGIAWWMGLLSVVLAFVLSLVACRATGETDTTPIGAMGKITQFTYAILAPGNTTANLMTAGITAGAAGSSADLLTDLKSGYLLGANPRKQFLAQISGVLFGVVVVIPAWYLMVPNKAALEHFNPPATNMWYAVAQALSQGIGVIPTSARWAIVIGGLIGIALPLLEAMFPKARPYLPSSMGLGLAFVVSFSNSLSFFLGALITWRWTAMNEKSADDYVVPIASGCIAGESLALAAGAILNTLGVLNTA
jgi:uncharacterized oligopeptide transporter (OPT) family protein